MPNNATMTSAVYGSNGKFGYDLSGGYALIPQAAFPASNTAVTVEAWVRRNGSPSAVAVAVGSQGTFWFGATTAGVATLHYGPTATEVTIVSSIGICDNVLHHIEANWDANGCRFYVDGVLAGSSATTLAASAPNRGSPIGVNAFAVGGASTGNAWGGDIDEVAFWSTARHTAAFTPPTAAYAGTETGLTGLYHLDQNGTDSVAAAATALTLSGSSSGVVGTSNQVTVGVNGALAANVTVNLTAADGAYSPSSVTLTPSATSGTSAYTPASSGAKTLTATDAAGVLTAATLSQTAGVPATGFDQTKILFSPLNWNVGTGTAKTINPGAYFRTQFSGTSIALSFDMTGILTPLPQLEYRIDQKAWAQIDLASTIALTMPSDTTTWAAHMLEVRFKAMTETQLRWATQATAVSLIGVTLDSGKALSLPPKLPLSIVGFGDSITEGCRTLHAAGTPDVASHDAAQSWLAEVAKRMGAEYGNIGFSAQGCLQGGVGSVPSFPNTWNYLYGTTPRVWTTAPDYIFINQGTNDTGDITSTMTTVLNGMLAATPTTTKIFVMRPYKDTTHTTQLQAAIAACSAPTRCIFLDTAGFFTAANSSDNLHPFGYEEINHIAPQVAAAARTALAAGPTLTARTVTVALADTTGTLANLTGLKVAFYDETTPDLHSVPRFKTASGATDSSGNLSFTVQSTLSVGGTGSLVVQMADGRNLVTSVAVA